MPRGGNLEARRPAVTAPSPGRQSPEPPAPGASPRAFTGHRTGGEPRVFLRGKRGFSSRSRHLHRHKRRPTDPAARPRWTQPSPGPGRPGKSLRGAARLPPSCPRDTEGLRWLSAGFCFRKCHRVGMGEEEKSAFGKRHHAAKTHLRAGIPPRASVAPHPGERRARAVFVHFCGKCWERCECEKRLVKARCYL